MNQITQKFEIYTANEKTVLAFCSTDLEHIFESVVGKEFGVLSGKEPQSPEFAHDIVRKHSLIIKTDIIEYNIVGDRKAPLLRCFLFVSKLKAGDIKTN